MILIGEIYAASASSCGSTCSNKEWSILQLLINLSKLKELMTILKILQIERLLLIQNIYLLMRCFLSGAKEGSTFK